MKFLIFLNFDVSFAVFWSDILLFVYFQISLFGMVVALAYCTAKYLKLFDDNNKRTLFSGPARVACLVFAVGALVVSLAVIKHNLLSEFGAEHKFLAAKTWRESQQRAAQAASSLTVLRGSSGQTLRSPNIPLLSCEG